MDSRVDFALDRTRLLAPSLGPPGTLAPMTSYASDLTHAGVSELARAATPSTMTSLAQFQTRFPSTMSMHSPGTSFALMGGFLRTAASPGDGLKSLMPDVQQLWAPPADGYPRFFINNNPYSPFGPFMSTADTLPALLPPGPSTHGGSVAAPNQAHAAHCHRIYELQKDAFLASAAASQAGLFGVLPSSQPFLDRNPSPPPPPPQPPVPPTLPLAVVKQEPREVPTCLGGERSSAKTSEKRGLVISTPRHLTDTSTKEPSREATLSGGSRSHSSHRPASGSKGQARSSGKKEAHRLRSGVEGQSRGADQRHDVITKPVETPERCSYEKTSTSSAFVSAKSARDVSKSAKDASRTSSPPSIHSSRRPADGQALGRTNGAANRDVAAPKSLTCDVRVSHGAEVPLKSGDSKKSSSALKAAGSICLPQGSASVSKSVVDVATATTAVAGSRTPRSKCRSDKKHGGVKASWNGGGGGGGSAASDKSGLPPEAWADPSSAKPSSATLSTTTSAMSVTTTSTTSFFSSSSSTVTAKATPPCAAAAASLAAVGLCPLAQPVPTVSTVTSTSGDSSSVTSVPVTSCGTQSVYSRTQPVVSTSVATTATAAPPLSSSSSVTSQITSALPYYHTLYSQPEGAGNGASGVRRVQATTTFVPEVGTYKGPLIRGMSKGCLEPRLKTEGPRSSCCHEGGGSPAAKPSVDVGCEVRTPSGGVEGAGDSSCDGGSGWEDKPSGLSAFSSTCHQPEGRLGYGSESASFGVGDGGHGEELSHRGGGRHEGFGEAFGDRSPSVTSSSCRTPLSSSSSSFHVSTTPSPSLHPSSCSSHSTMTAGFPDVALDFSISRRGGDDSVGGSKTTLLPRRPCVSEKQESETTKHAHKPSPGRAGGSSSSRHRGDKVVLKSDSTDRTSCKATLLSPAGPRMCSLLDHSLKEGAVTSLPFHPALDRARQSSGPHQPSAGKLTVTSQPCAESHQALNLTKPSSSRRTETAANAANSSAIEKPGQGPESEVIRPLAVLRMMQMMGSGEVRCGSAPPRASVPSLHGKESPDDKDDDDDECADEEDDVSVSEGLDKEELTEHIASNIPVGIAVAQQRPDTGRVDTRQGINRADHHLRPTDDSDVTCHEYKEREDFHRQQKSLLTGAAKPIPNTTLPPNLVVTGGDNALTEELRLRPLTNQWIAASHGLAPSAWLPQPPFTLHPGIPTSTATFDTSHHPISSGFKLAQDPLTGQLLLIPSGDIVEQNPFWSAAFQNPATTQALPAAPSFTHLTVPLSQHAQVTAAALSADDNGRLAQEVEENGRVPRPVEQAETVQEDSREGSQSSDTGLQPQSCSGQVCKDKPVPPTSATTTAAAGNGHDREKQEPVSIANSFMAADLASQAFPYQTAAAAASLTSTQFPFVFNSALLPLPSGLSLGEALPIKTEAPTTQSRGTSPIIFSALPSSDVTQYGGVKEAAVAADIKKEISTCCVSVQTTSDLDPQPTARKVVSKEQGIQTSELGHSVVPLVTSEVGPMQPLSVICSSADFALQHHAAPPLLTRHEDSSPLGTVAAVASAAMAAEERLGGHSGSVGITQHGPAGGTYNPFTDPQLLQAADGLELLSTLAEKRPKCGSAFVDPKVVFPSPSDSFKSDTPLPCVELDDTVSVGEGERSGQTTPRGDRHLDREVSPKWGVVRKDSTSAPGEYKVSSSLASMDALEWDMRLRLAELQRQYREKQRELAKLQPRKDKDGDSSSLGKRGRGRPRKRKFVSKKADDESSNSSSGKGNKEGVVKKRRPAEELVDRVFRKLPPAKLGRLKLFTHKHKRRHSLSLTSHGHYESSKDIFKKKDAHRHDTGNLFTNLENSLAQSAEKKKLKYRTAEITATATSAMPGLSSLGTMTSETGLGILAKFASSALSASFQATKAKSEETYLWGSSSLSSSIHKRRTDPGEDSCLWGGSSLAPSLSKRRESDTDNSDTANGPCVKKRKPGRPRKCDPNKTTGVTETIWARQTGLLQLSDVAQGKTWVAKAEETATATAVTTATTTTSTTTVAFSATTTCVSFGTTASKPSSASSAASSGQATGQHSLAPLLLDEWSLRRSERIFLSDTSPLPSPNLQPPARDAVSAGKLPAARDNRSNSVSSRTGGTARGRPPGNNKARRTSSGGSDQARARPPSEGSGKDKEEAQDKDQDKDKEVGTVAKVTTTAAAAAAAATTTVSPVVTREKVKDEKRDRDLAKVQKARSLHELTQRVKRKYSKSLCKKPAAPSPSPAADERQKKKIKDKTESIARPSQVPKKVEAESDSSSEGDNVPLSSLRDRPVTPEPPCCTIRQEDLKEGQHVLLFRDALFYEGIVQAIQPPDIYGVVVTGQRGSRPHIYSREEILRDAIKVVPPSSQRYVPEGTRVCAYWSQQFRCLYPGTVAKTSPNPHVTSSVNVEFDDGDSGRIPLAHVRLLPSDFPLITQEPNPLLYFTKRRRRTTSDDDFSRSSENIATAATASGTSDSGATARRRNVADNSDTDSKNNSNSSAPVKDRCGKTVSRSKTSSSAIASSSTVTSGQGQRDDRKKSKKVSNRPSAPLLRPASFNPKRACVSKNEPDSKEAASEDDEDDGDDEDDEEEEEEEEDDDDEDSSADNESGDEEEDSHEDAESDESEDEPLAKKSEKKTDKKLSTLRSKSTRGTSHGGSSSRRKKKKASKELRAYMAPRLLWRWAGRSTKRPGMKGKARKEFYRSIVRGSDHIMVGDSAVFLSTGRDNCPYVGRIESLWASWGGQMTVRVKWFYHPEETKGGKQLAHPKGALFESPHGDENDVQTISHKCQVLPFKDYMRRTAEASRRGQPLGPNIYYLAGYYDPTIGLLRFEPDVV